MKVFRFYGGKCWNGSDLIKQMETLLRRAATELARRSIDDDLVRAVEDLQARPIEAPKRGFVVRMRDAWEALVR